MSLRSVPMTLDRAQAFVGLLHRHHDAPVGHRFSLGCATADDVLRGVAVVSRPVARKTDRQAVAEVTRLCTDGHKNACSYLYALAARVCKEMGFRRIQTFILDSESGVSLLAAGWRFDGWVNPASWKTRSGRKDVPGRRQRWVKDLNT